MTKEKKFYTIRNDIIFKIVKIEKDRVILRGADIRLYADAPINDLVLSTIRKEEPTFDEIRIDKKKEAFKPLLSLLNNPALVS